MLIVVYLILGGAIVGAGALVANALLDSSRKTARTEQRAAAVAQKALRSIANNTSGNPVLDAQIALDDMYDNRKELN